MLLHITVALVRDCRFLPQVLFVCTSGKEGGRGLKPWKTKKLEEKPEENMQGGGLLGKLNLREPLIKEV